MNYTCPVCGQKTPRDLVVFLDHTNEHIYELMKKKHPEWSGKDGLCSKCHEHLKAILKGEAVK